MLRKKLEVGKENIFFPQTERINLQNYLSGKKHSIPEYISNSQCQINKETTKVLKWAKALNRYLPMKRH